ncbi:MAG: exodeoxyribonuclease V subunit gamma [Acidimicrobiales bacterium]|nr:exodeoxyribonuclease V subunit gamma [Acidimicrobiales bacterium]
MFTIHRSERADVLLGALVDLVSDPLDDPFRAEVVAVPTRGVERWLTQKIAEAVGTSPGRTDGVCANVEFPFPGRLVGDVLAEATGVDRDEDPWRSERLAWPLLATIDDHATEPWLGMVGTHLGAVRTDDGYDELRSGRRWSTARHLAELFDGYSVFRPAMVRAWLDGEDGDLPDDARWQPELYRRVARRIGTPSPPERLETACVAIATGEATVGLPGRISLFGLTTLPGSYLEVLRAVAERHDVHLFALHPSAVWWDEVAGAGVDGRGLARADDETRGLAHHPLLQTWADDVREMQLVLAGTDAQMTEHRAVAEPAAASLLSRLQADVRADRAPAGPGDDGRDDRPVLAPDDRSIQVHECHGRLRQVEVLRDAIGHLLADHEHLEPRDVIVLCPDIETYAPHLHAVFGAPEPRPDDDPGGRDDPGDGLPALPYRLADRSLRQTNPLLGVLADLLDLADTRITAGDVLDLAGKAPVRARFSFDDDDLDRVGRWLEATAIRWGLDPEHRRHWSLQAISTNTWRAGLDRILLGVTMDEDGTRTVGGRLPLDDVDSGDIDLAGRLAELVDRLATLVDVCRSNQPIGSWLDTCERLVDLLAAAPGADAWQRAQLDGVLRDVSGESAGSDTPLSLDDVRALLARRLEGVPSRAHFRTGAMTMCTLVPMRAIPHPVVCLLGLDADDFPRVGMGDGDDLLRRQPLVGDRDPRREDRQLLLDAVMAATEHLVVTYSARDERTNEDRPPAVPLAELLDVIDDTARAAEGRARDQVVRSHPLHPFDADAHHPDDPWGFAASDLAGARAAAGPRREPPPLLSAPLPELPEDVVDLGELIRFVQHPMREFLRQRLEVSTWSDDGLRRDDIPYELDGLAQWRIGQRLLSRRMAGESLEAVTLAEQTLGFLPPNDLGYATLTPIYETVNRIHGTAEALGVSGPPASLEVDVACGGVRVVGTVPGVHDTLIAGVSYSSIKPKDRLASWTRLLALSAAHPEQAWESVVVGRQKRNAAVVRHRALDPDDRAERALELLGRLVALRRAGLREPLPLPCATGEAWANAARWRRTPEENASREWTSTFNRDNEDRDPSHVLVLGGVRPFVHLLEQTPAADEHGAGWDAEQTTRLGRLAHRVWGPILAREANR